VSEEIKIEGKEAYLWGNRVYRFTVTSESASTATDRSDAKVLKSNVTEGSSVPVSFTFMLPPKDGQ